ncbi:hypothetical protein SCARR_04560 [Pontiella sulfatireligans]|uniref:DUF5060 domain-containing protein n=2 Tax=Pontiella sulfatireligans TaxID=2750658 RepID=A0A6C2UTE6_9BACT|nr:hypothetical protein SCARR_04560 [Pontiella sulfatireligans]
MKLLLGLVLMMFVAGQAAAIQTLEHSMKTKRANQWEVVDIHFPVSTLTAQPEDAVLTAELKKGGEVLNVHGFYDGGKTYTLRFTASAEGDWTYQLSSSIKELDGLSGKLTVDAPKEGRKGGIKIDPKQPRNFVYENGESYYPICFEVDWLFALDAENLDDIPVTRTFVNTVAENGYNQVIMNAFAYDVTWKKDDKLKPEHEYGHPSVFPFFGSNEVPDHSKLNIEYFKRLDRVVEYLNDKGIASHLMIYVWNKEVNWPEADSAEDNRYFDYVVKRYQAFPNMVWDISKEALGYGHSDVGYITRRIERLRKLDTHQRLVTVHDYGYCGRFPEKLDFISVQLWGSELHSIMTKVRADFPGKPILNIEHGGYERSPYVVFNGAYTRPDVCLERAYQCVFAGTYPSHYWQGAAWNVIIPDLGKLPEEQRPKLEYYRHMSELVKRYDLGSLKAGDKKSNSGFALHDGKDRIVYYVPKENDFLGLKPGVLEGDFVTATWFDPFTGVYEKPIRKKLTKWLSFNKPEGEGFRILILEVVQ